MSTGYKISEKEGAYFLTFQIVGWEDIFPEKYTGTSLLIVLSFVRSIKP
jgi:hypothetical protein